MARLDVKGFFQNLHNIDSISEAKEMAQRIVDNPGIFGGLGNSSPVSAANATLIMLNDFSKGLTDEEAEAKLAQARSDQEAGINLIPRGDSKGQNRSLSQFNRAIGFLSGSLQPTRFRSLFNKSKKNIDDLEKKLKNEIENLANVAATPVSERTANQNEQIQRRQEKVQELSDQLQEYGQFFGEDFSQGFPELAQRAERVITETNAGRAQSFEPTLSGGRNPNQTVGRAGEPLIIDQETFEIKGVNTGTVYGKGQDLQDALAMQTEIQSGSRPDPVGAFSQPDSAAGGDSGLGGGGSSAVLPDGVDTSGLSGEDVAALEDLYNQSQEDPNLISLQTITDEDIAGFLETAKAELSPFFEQKIRRAKEDFVRGLQFKAEDREAQIVRERLAAQVALEAKQQELADSGLASSGIRSKAEARLAEEAADIAESSRRKFEFTTDTLGREAEDLLGSANIADIDIPEIGGEDIFEASGDVRGSVERDQVTAEQVRAGELEDDARNRRLGVLDADEALSRA